MRLTLTKGPEGGWEPGRRSGAGLGSLWLHLERDRNVLVRPSLLLQQPPDRKNFTVLVVDDSPAARYAMARNLQMAGYNTMAAAGGAEGLALEESASAVILDVHLPDIHGLEVCRILRRRRPDLPIVNVSALHLEPQDVENARKAGANGYLVAPVPPDELIAAVDMLIGHAQDLKGDS